MGRAEGDLMELNGWSSPQMLARYGRSARSTRARRHYDDVMGTEAPMAKNINARIAAEASWARTHGRSARVPGWPASTRRRQLARSSQKGSPRRWPLGKRRVPDDASAGAVYLHDPLKLDQLLQGS